MSVEIEDVAAWGCGAVLVVLGLVVVGGLLFAATLIIHAAWYR